MHEDYMKIDAEEASERLKIDQSIVKMLIKKFLDSDLLEKAEKAFEEANIEEARLAVHSIKGSAANVGVTGLSKLALEMETKIKENEYLDFEALNIMKKVWNDLKEESL